MEDDYGNNNQSNGAAEVDMQEEPDEYFKNVDKQDLRDALFLLIGLREGMGLDIL